MDILCQIKFGSHLYGTNTPASDLDLKSVYVPDGREILLGTARDSIRRGSRDKADGERNTAADVDDELYSLKRYLGLLCEGQTVALDMLFAPDWAMLEPPGKVWHDIRDARHSLVTSKSASFVGYCRTQANKYGIKGSRVAAARLALATLDAAVWRLGTQAKLHAIAPEIEGLAKQVEHIDIVDIEQIGGQLVRHLDVCGRKMQFTGTIKSAAEIMQRLVGEYGRRALMAEQQQGVDWKALSHAVRVGYEAIELLLSGSITFPLPNAERVLNIKLGKFPYQEVAAEIESLLGKVEVAAKLSRLRAEPDMGIVNDIIARAYGESVLADTASALLWSMG